MEELNKDGQESRRNPMTKVYKIIDGLKRIFRISLQRKSKVRE